MSGLEPGFQLGHYRIVRSLGSGGMADVYEAQDTNLERVVALKILPIEYCRNPNLVARFQKEVRAAAKLNHRNIVTVFEVGQQDSYHFFSMRLLTGGDLRRRIEDGLTPVESLAILRELADAFAHAHARGFVHRDVKPENIMFDEQGFPVLTDFGIAKALDANTHMTRTGMTMGTPRYLSPEQASGKPVDARADLYSLGVILHEMLTGKPPYDAEESMAVIFKHVTEPVPTLPPDFARYQGLLEKLMAKDPAKRVGSAEELIREIDAVVPRQVTAELKQSQLRTTENPLVAKLMTPSPLRTPAPKTPRPVTPPPLTPPPVAPSAPQPVVRDMSGEIAVRAPPVSAPAARRPAAPPAPEHPGAVIRPAPAPAAAVPAARRSMPLLVGGGVAAVAIAGGAAVYLLKETGPAPGPAAPAVQPAPVQPDATAEAEQRGAEQRQRAATEAKQRAEQEAARKAAADLRARQQAEADAKQRAADLETAQKKAAAEAQAKRQAEAEARRKAELEAQRRAASEAEAKQRAETEARRKAELEAQRKADTDAEARRRAAEIEAAARQRDAEEAARRAGKAPDPRAAAAEARRKKEDERAKEEQAAKDEEEQKALERSRRPTGF